MKKIDKETSEKKSVRNLVSQRAKLSLNFLNIVQFFKYINATFPLIRYKILQLTINNEEPGSEFRDMTKKLPYGVPAANP